MDEFVQSFGIAGISKSQVSQMAKSLDREAEAFRTRSLRETSYPILIVDALYEKVRVDGVVQSTAVMVVCGINAEGKREVVGIELMPEESSISKSVQQPQGTRPRQNSTYYLRCT